MKFTMPAIVLAGTLLAAAPGCGDRDKDSAPAAAYAPASAPVDATPAATDNTKVPDTIKIDGKTVKLKKTASGLRYYDTKIGTGPNPKIGQTVSVQYTGSLLDGTKFDSSYDHGGTPIDFPIGVGQVIKGWDEGVPPMKVGGKRRLVIPGDLAYGANPPTPTIPPNATLVFDIELVAVK
ncbi:MAG: FKBP-type peptidyl-prolyl cis-trans isomerase [Armatimonadota bacterium]|nr:FKBP-type peptidyl-prolyl cis-trans isomerase [Armatimonadota bacterium]